MWSQTSIAPSTQFRAIFPFGSRVTSLAITWNSVLPYWTSGRLRQAELLQNSAREPREPRLDEVGVNRGVAILDPLLTWDGVPGHHSVGSQMELALEPGMRSVPLTNIGSCNSSEPRTMPVVVRPRP